MTTRRFAHFPDAELRILCEVLARATDAFAAALASEAIIESRLRTYRGARPALPADIEQMLDSMEKHIMSDPNLDAIANDWPALRDAITSRITNDSDTIAKLTAELATAATSSTPLSDERAAQIDTEMKAALQSLTGTASAVQSANPTSSGSTGATGATGSSAASPTGATGSTGTTGSTSAGSTSAAVAGSAVPPAGSAAAPNAGGAALGAGSANVGATTATPPAGSTGA